MGILLMTIRLTMSLLMDGIAYNVAKTVININILKQIEDDLEIDEKISILFMIFDYASGFNNIFELFKINTKNAYIIVDYVKNNPENWEEKVLEALCILNNRQVLKKLGISFSVLDLQYVPKLTSYSKSINVIAKCLYKLCESLNESEQKLLLNYVKSEIHNYEPLLDNVDYLELHMLYWIQIGYITISKDKMHNMKKLLKHLKKFEDGHIKIICMEMEKFENGLHVVDNCKTFGTNNENYLQSTPSEESSFIKRHYRKKIQLINSGLCIIINQMYFMKEYETRFGTRADCINLSETFKTFGFRVEIFQNLKKNEILEKIKNISKDYGIKYDCLFLCILSHGYKGGIIASDEEEVSLETIERALCCLELKDVIKIVIIQACQGKICGTVSNSLTTDGLYDSFTPTEDIRQFANFFMFMSTIQGFLSIRHQKQGSWFIQEVCRIFKTYGNQLSFYDCVREIMKSIREKKGTIDGNQIAQLTEIRLDRLESDFQLKQIDSAV
ncbi:caspase-8 [Mycetomoellerius zeteki]|uniref:caspase-8 n=1 Tax=Mycetomoellerius zeteki TaxID=64791 RepID=UPI00084E6066|nr:PREDICTED: caspase-8-like [Trachymyrmex zeteki]